MRSKKAVVNTVSGITFEIIAFLSNFLFLRKVLSTYGSDFNGIIASITNLVSFAVLFRAGIGGVTRAALYHPLATKDTKEISGIVNATSEFLNKVALLFAITIFVFAIIYPFFVLDSFNWVFVFSLVLIMASKAFFDTFIGLSYQIILNADQRQSVVLIFRSITTILYTITSLLLMSSGAAIHVVMLLNSIISILVPISIKVYAINYYKINKTIPPIKKAVEQRWDCFGIQVANFINTNTAIIIITILLDVLEASVYSVYYMVCSSMRRLFLVFVNSFGSAFGNMFAKEEKKAILQNFLIYEQITFSISNVLFSVAAVMILSFIQIYTKGILDVEYYRPSFAYTMLVMTLFGVYRIPYQHMTEAVGHFRQTRNGAFLEATINIMLSIALISWLGIISVAIGALFATVFRTFRYAFYMSKYVIIRPISIFLKRIVLSIGNIGMIIIVVRFCALTVPRDYSDWIINGFLVTGVAIVVTLCFELCFYRNDLVRLIKKLRIAFLR